MRTVQAILDETMCHIDGYETAFAVFGHKSEAFIDRAADLLAGVRGPVIFSIRAVVATVANERRIVDEHLKMWE